VLEQAFAQWQDELLGTLYCLLGNREDAQDAYQEVFLRCWRHNERVARIGNLKAWIFRIALNLGRDLRGATWRRRHKPLPEDEAILAARASDRSGAETSRREKLALARRGLLDLRPEEQEVFLLWQNGEMTYEEIAKAMNIPVGAAKNRMSRALQKLRAALVPESAD
jgi:RNA polymerase sigma factor (sigma-70 family)